MARSPYQQGIADLMAIVGQDGEPLPFDDGMMGEAVQIAFRDIARNTVQGADPHWSMDWHALPPNYQRAYIRVGTLVGRMTMAGVAGRLSSRARALYVKDGK